MAHKIPDPDAIGAAVGSIQTGTFSGKKGTHRYERSDDLCQSNG